MKKLIIASLVMVMSAGSVFAQQMPLFSSYNTNKMLLSPSTTGMDQLVSTSLISRLQFAGFEGAPLTNVLLAEIGKPESPSGAGLIMYSDRIGVVRNLGAQLNYGYRLKLSDDMKIGFGLGLAFDQWNYDPNRVSVDDINDPQLFNTNENSTTIRGDIGAHLDYKNLFVSVAVPKVFATDVTYKNPLTSNEVSIQQLRHILGYASYDIHTKSGNYVITPAALVRIAADVDAQIDANVTVGYQEKFFGMVGYRVGYAATLGAGMQFSQRVRGGYNYDFPINGTTQYGTGSHELMLKIQLGRILDAN